MRPAALDFRALKIDAFLVTGAHNVRYLSGYTGSNGMLILRPGGEAMFFTDPRYEIQSHQEVIGAQIVIVRTGGLAAAAAAWMKKKRIKRAGFEGSRVSYHEYLFFDENSGGARFLPAGPLIEGQRMVKDADEIDKIRRSVLTNSAAFDRVTSKIHVGTTERDVAAELEYQMRRLGAEQAAFETIVAAGPRTALPHARPTSRKIANNELLLIDVGAFQDGYASDMTRMLHFGKVPSATAKMYKAVRESQLAAIDAVREGATAGSVDREARRVLAAYGLAEKFTHSTGHGLGLEIHEPPRIGRKDKTRLRAGMAITIEPGAYIENVGGIRIEDTVVVTRAGCEVLTPTPKELVKL